MHLSVRSDWIAFCINKGAVCALPPYFKMTSRPLPLQVRWNQKYSQSVTGFPGLTYHISQAAPGPCSINAAAVPFHQMQEPLCHALTSVYSSLLCFVSHSLRKRPADEKHKKIISRYKNILYLSGRTIIARHLFSDRTAWIMMVKRKR